MNPPYVIKVRKYKRLRVYLSEHFSHFFCTSVLFFFSFFSSFFLLFLFFHVCVKVNDMHGTSYVSCTYDLCFSHTPLFSPSINYPQKNKNKKKLKKSKCQTRVFFATLLQMRCAVCRSICSFLFSGRESSFANILLLFGLFTIFFFSIIFLKKNVQDYKNKERTATKNTL